MKSASYAAYDQVSTPSAGGTQCPGKSNDCDEALGTPRKQNQATFVATAVDGAARKAVEKQTTGYNPKKRTSNSFGAATEGNSHGAK